MNSHTNRHSVLDHLIRSLYLQCVYNIMSAVQIVMLPAWRIWIQVQFEIFCSCQYCVYLRRFWGIRNSGRILMHASWYNFALKSLEICSSACCAIHLTIAEMNLEPNSKILQVCEISCPLCTLTGHSTTDFKAPMTCFIFVLLCWYFSFASLQSDLRLLRCSSYPHQVALPTSIAIEKRYRACCKSQVL